MASQLSSIYPRPTTFWTSHCFEPTGCGGPSFSLHVQAQTRPELRITATFQGSLVRCQPQGLNITGQRDELQEIDAAVWDDLCHGLTVPTVTSLGYTTAFCRRGYDDKRVICLLKKRDSLPDITDFTIQDGLYGYADTFLELHRLPNLEQLTLRDSSYGVMLGRDVCEALALAIRSLKKLKHIQLASLCFRCQDDWNIVLNALTSHSSLESVDFFRLQMGNEKADFSADAMIHPVFLEKKRVFGYLGDAFPNENCFSVAQVLQAYLHVRAGLKLTNARTPLALRFVADKPDLFFELLRNQVDVSIWLR